jgi:drug/metabolite transporter (DMT)-like permease
MRLLNYAALLAGSLAAAAGQMMLKHGAQGRTAPVEFLNGAIGGGLALYAIGTVLWIFVLAREPLSAVYPFAILTFVLVMAGATLLQGERISFSLAFGGLLVLAGLLVVVLGQIED